MDTGSPNKFRYARQVAAALAYIALGTDDRVGVYPFDGSMGAPFKPVRGRRNALRLIRWLADLEPGSGTNLVESLTSFASATPEVRVTGSLAASAEHFVGLPYRNPPGGTKTCLNSKLARCDLTIRRHGAAPRTLTCRDRAAFEILTDDDDHGVPVLELDAGRGGCHR